MFAIHAILILALPACSEPVAPETVTTQPSTSLTSAPLPANVKADSRLDEPVTEAEAEVAARQLEQAVARANVSEFNSYFDWDAFLDRVTQGIEVPATAANGFRVGFKQSNDFASQIINAAGMSGSYRLLRVHQKDGTTRGLFRLISNAGVNYHDLVFERRPSGKVQVVDAYVFMGGEMLSESIRRMYIAMAADVNQSIVTKLFGGESDIVKAVPIINNMRQAMMTKNYQGMLAEYHKLPDSVKQQRPLLVMRYMAAQNLGPEELAKAIDDFRRYDPNAACLDLLLIDHYFTLNQFQLARDSLDRLDKEVQDPYLDLMRAGTYLQEGNEEEGNRLIEKALEADPTLAQLGL